MRKLAAGLTGLFAFLIELDVGHSQRSRVGDGLQKPHVGRRDIPDLRPVGAHCADGILLAHRRHGEAADECGPVGIVRDARIRVDIANGNGLPLDHALSRNARLHGKPAPLPERSDRLLLRVIALLTVAKDEGDPVGMEQVTGGMGDDFHDQRNAAREREGANDGDERRRLVRGLSRRLKCDAPSGSHQTLLSRPPGSDNAIALPDEAV